MNWLAQQLEIAHGKHTPLRPMEGLRGVAVFLVFWVHYCALIEPWLNTSSLAWWVKGLLDSLGHTGVDLFFVLSGYLIYGTLLRKQSTQFQIYIKRRIVRIYPVFLAVLCVYLVLSVVMPSESKLPEGVPATVLYIVQNLLLLPGLADIEPIITVAWSLSYEFFYYLFIPLIIAILHLRKWTPNMRIVFWLFMSVIGFVVFYFLGGPVRLMMFVAGILLYEFHTFHKLRLPRYAGTLCFFAALILFALNDQQNIHYVLSIAALFILFFVLCYESFTDSFGSARWLCFTPLRWLGNMSYSYYLIHGLTLKGLFLVLKFIMPPASESSTLFFWLWMPFSSNNVSFIFCPVCGG